MYTQWQLRQAANLPDINVPHQTLSDWLARQWEYLRKFFAWLFNWNAPRFRGPNLGGLDLPAILKAIAWFIGTIALLFIFVMLIKTFGKLNRDGPLPNVLSREQIQRAMDSGDALALGTVQWMAEAQRLADEQNFRAVYRALYLALLSGLHLAGKIEHNRNRTNWTYVQHFRGPDQERSTFSELTELFDRVWYGRKAAESRNLDELRRTVAALVGGGKA